jgi:hypothetical protein
MARTIRRLEPGNNTFERLHRNTIKSQSPVEIDRISHQSRSLLEKYETLFDN